MKNLKYSLLFMILAIFLSSKSFGTNEFIFGLNEDQDELKIILNSRDDRYDITEVSGQVYNMP